MREDPKVKGHGSRMNPPSKRVLLPEEEQSDALNLAEKKEWRDNEVTFDLAATDPVMPTRMCDDITLQPSPQSLRGAGYEVANGETNPNVGVRRCIIITEGSAVPKLMHVQVLDVHKPLLSATDECWS